MNEAYWLTNVTLDSGFVFENGRIDRTKTAAYNMYIKNGVIKELQLASGVPLKTDDPVHDAGKLLALPPFKEMHNHLDKTYLGLPWKSCTPVPNLIERLKLEAKELAGLAETGRLRAERMLQLLLSGGATHVRTHVNVDPYIGMKNLEEIQRALYRFNGKMTYEIVAFPQHGLLRTNSKGLMRQAMKEGASLVGGLDPGGVDNNIEASLYEMVDLAVEFDADIDIHIHDPGHLGLYTIKKLASLIDEAGWKNRAAISHAFALGDVSIGESDELASELSNLGVAIMSTVPINRVIPRLIHCMKRVSMLPSDAMAFMTPGPRLVQGICWKRQDDWPKGTTGRTSMHCPNRSNSLREGSRHWTLKEIVYGRMWEMTLVWFLWMLHVLPRQLPGDRSVLRLWSMEIWFTADSIANLP